MNTHDFANKVSAMSLDKRIKAATGLRKLLEGKTQPDGKPWTDEIRKAVEQLDRWLFMNILIGSLPSELKNF